MFDNDGVTDCKHCGNACECQMCGHCTSCEAVTAEQIARHLFAKDEPLGQGEKWECAAFSYQQKQIEKAQEILDAISEIQSGRQVANSCL